MFVGDMPMVVKWLGSQEGCLLAHRQKSGFLITPVKSTDASKGIVVTCSGFIDLRQFVILLTDSGWTNLRGEFGPRTRGGVNDRGAKQ